MMIAPHRLRAGLFARLLFGRSLFPMLFWRGQPLRGRQCNANFVRLKEGLIDA
jgi:hypothetical protein